MKKNRFHSSAMASNYDKMCQLFVLDYKYVQDILIGILKFKQMEQFVLLNLGAGGVWLVFQHR